jgi:hypothetical protein
MIPIPPVVRGTLTPGKRLAREKECRVMAKIKHLSKQQMVEAY